MKICTKFVSNFGTNMKNSCACGTASTMRESTVEAALKLMKIKLLHTRKTKIMKFVVPILQVSPFLKNELLTMTPPSFNFLPK